MEIRDWQGRTGESWAAEWKRTDRSFGGLTERLLARTRELPFRRAVDIGCGAGELTLALARSRPQSQVVGVDLSPDLIAVARERGQRLTNVTFVEGDAAEWRSLGPRPELLVSRHGVMFFEDSPAAFRHLADAAADDARLLFSCFREAAENPIFTEVGAQLPPPADAPPPDPHAPGPFAFAERDYVGDLLTAAGWADVRFEAHDFAMIAGAGDEPVDDAVSYWSTIGPSALRLAEMDDVTRRECELRLAELARRHLRDGVVALRAAAWIVTARKA